MKKRVENSLRSNYFEIQQFTKMRVIFVRLFFFFLLSMALSLIISTKDSFSEDKGEVKKSSTKMVYEFEEMVIEGRIHKPRAFFILPRAPIDTKSLDYNESFLPKITKSVEEKPF